MDKVYEVGVIEELSSTIQLPLNNTSTATVSNTTWDGYYTSPYTYYWGNTIYLYQIICPKPRCKTSNWLEINKEKECSKCGSVLKAVSRKADYEVEVE